MSASTTSALADWAAAHKKELKVVSQRRDADGPMVDRALEIVRQFIVGRGLILFGGLAIDYALRLKGAHIYPDDERPDFDVLSPRSVDDAYDLADILAAAGFENVGAIRAIHVQTMRVRTSFITVADIGYAPPAVFERLPTLEWRGMRIIHPDYQRMDQHLAFCFPFNGPPQEDVYHRWKKDLERFNLFEQHYPIAFAAADADARAIAVTARLAVPVSVAIDSASAETETLSVALHGFAAYAAMRACLAELAATLSPGANKGKAPRKTETIALSFPDANSVAVAVPAGVAPEVHFASPDPAAAVAGLSGAQWFDPYMDVNPESVRADKAVVLSTRARLLAASAVQVGGRRVRIVSPQYLLLHFMFQSFRATDEIARDVYRAHYRATLDMLAQAEKLIAASSACNPDDLFVNSPFGPTVHTLGDVNHDAAYIIKMASSAEKLHDTPPPALRLDSDIASLLVGLPQNYYQGKQRPTFDYNASPLFHRAGEAKAHHGNQS